VEERSVCVLGVGGGGVRIAGRLAGMAPTGAVIAAVDTDSKALTESGVGRRIRIGDVRTGGRGAGGDREIGRLAAAEEAAQVGGLFEEAGLVIVLTALGGGTGTGATPVLLAAAREAGCATLCIATLPFAFEGGSRAQTAEAALPAIEAAADAVIAVANDRLFDSVREATVSAAFLKADEVLSTSVRAIWRLVTNPGYINLTLADLLATVRGSGHACSLAYGTGTGKTKVQKAVKQLLEGPMTEGGDLLARSKSVLVSIVGGPDLAVKDVGKIMNALHARLPADARVSMGTVIDEALHNKLTVTVVFGEAWLGEEAARPAPRPAPAPRKEPARSGPAKDRKKKRRTAQRSLGFDTAGRERFKGVEATVLNGQELDTPTYRRRGIDIPKPQTV
jgi:cell division protein FtsZ